MLGRPRGFTLVEVLVVITLLSVLLALGVPALGTYTANVRLRTAAEKVLADLQRARSRSHPPEQQFPAVLSLGDASFGRDHQQRERQ
jgi:prepilin-type N-terminal cleavage/methylation domain-containing protein